MNGREIKTGETYFFVATDSPARKHLEGTEFTVFEIKKVWRRFKRSKLVKRFFNEAGEGARAEELEPMNDFVPCENIQLTDGGEMVTVATFDLDKDGKVSNFTPVIKQSDYKDDDGLPF